MTNGERNQKIAKEATCNVAAVADVSFSEKACMEIHAIILDAIKRAKAQSEDKSRLDWLGEHWFQFKFEFDRLPLATSPRAAIDAARKKE